MFKSFEEFKENTWTTAYGDVIKFKDLTDNHLINLVYHCEKYRHCSGLTPWLMLLVKSRGLTQVDLDRAQIPHTRDGKKMMWNYENHQMEEVC